MTKPGTTDSEDFPLKPESGNNSEDDPLIATGQIDVTSAADRIVRANTGKKTPCFVVLQGADVGSIIPIDKPRITIGRAPECDAVMREEGISRTHAKVEMVGESTVVITDLRSTNGTFVEGKRVEAATLESGDKLLLGRNTVLKFVFQDQIDLRYHQEMYDSTIRDGLTGIYNRRYFNERIVTDLSFTRRHRHPLSFMILDIDHFKNVNDTYGHQTGDQVLITIANAVAQMIRAEDVFARYGGEEFAIIAANLDFDGGVKLAERIREHLASKTIEAVDDSDKTLSITVSFGVVTISPASTEDSFAVVSTADRNLYKAKENGRNQTVASELE